MYRGLSQHSLSGDSLARQGDRRLARRKLRSRRHKGEGRAKNRGAKSLEGGLVRRHERTSSRMARWPGGPSLEGLGAEARGWEGVLVSQVSYGPPSLSSSVSGG